MATSASSFKRTVLKNTKAVTETPKVVTETPVETTHHDVAPTHVASDVTETPKKARAPSSKKTPAPTPAPAPVAAVVEPTPVVHADVPEPVAASVPVPTESSWNNDLAALNHHITTLRETATTLLSEFKRVEKKIARAVKDAGKRRKVRAKVDENGVELPKRAIGFNKPVAVSDALSHFLGLEKGALVARSAVTKAVTTYAKEKGLMSGQNITPDAVLDLLLQPETNIPIDAEGVRPPLDIFNLQKCLSKHYVAKATHPSA